MTPLRRTSQRDKTPMRQSFCNQDATVPRSEIRLEWAPIECTQNVADQRLSRHGDSSNPSEELHVARMVRDSAHADDLDYAGNTPRVIIGAPSSKRCAIDFCRTTDSTPVEIISAAKAGVSLCPACNFLKGVGKGIRNTAAFVPTKKGTICCHENWRPLTKNRHVSSEKSQSFHS